MRKSIVEYRNTIKLEEINPAIIHDINALEICISLCEIFIYYRDLSNEEKRWFQGSRFIDDTFSGKWKIISINYEKMSSFIEENKKLVR